MSLELSYTSPKAVAACHFHTSGITLSTAEDTNELFIPPSDLAALFLYFLTNTDLTAAPDDPRLWLLQQLKKIKVVPGYNPGHTRLALMPPDTEKSINQKRNTP